MNPVHRDRSDDPQPSTSSQVKAEATSDDAVPGTSKTADRSDDADSGDDDDEPVLTEADLIESG